MYNNKKISKLDDYGILLSFFACGTIFVGAFSQLL